MYWDVIEENWTQYKGQWGKLTNDHLDVIAGKREQLSGPIQQSYVSPGTMSPCRSTTQESSGMR